MEANNSPTNGAKQLPGRMVVVFQVVMRDSHHLVILADFSLGGWWWQRRV